MVNFHAGKPKKIGGYSPTLSLKDTSQGTTHNINPWSQNGS